MFMPFAEEEYLPYTVIYETGSSVRLRPEKPVRVFLDGRPVITVRMR